VIRLSLDIQPVPKGRPRACTVGGKPRIYTPPQTAEYEGRVEAAAKAAMNGSEPLQGPLAVTLHFRLPIPTFARKRNVREAAESGASRPVNPRSGDVDNLAKAVLDACNGVLWVDDCQIVLLVAGKRWGITPGFDMTVEAAK
jgi:Holliday junction resolvase RusA-like endonuclease